MARDTSSERRRCRKRRADRASGGSVAVRLGFPAEFLRIVTLVATVVLPVPPFWLTTAIITSVLLVVHMDYEISIRVTVTELLCYTLFVK